MSHRNCRHLQTRPQGFSLLEVILALAILAGAIAVLGEILRIGGRNAAATQVLTKAQMLCENKLAEITADTFLPDPITGAELETGIAPEDQSKWLYSVEIEDLGNQEMVAIRVTIEQNLETRKNPPSVSLVRWMLNPETDWSGTGEEEGSSSSGGSRG